MHLRHVCSEIGEWLVGNDAVIRIYTGIGDAAIRPFTGPLQEPPTGINTLFLSTTGKGSLSLMFDNVPETGHLTPGIRCPG